MTAPKLKVVESGKATRSVYHSIQKFSLEGLNDLIRVLMESVDDALFELSDKVDNDRERNLYFEAMREVRLKRDGLQKNFDHAMHRRFAAFAKGKKLATEVEDETELTLVELDDLEDNIAIENMVSRARPQYEDSLLAISARLKVVLKREAIDADDNPLDPHAICECFHEASQLLETDIQIKLIFYKLFERYVMNRLGHFYQELNELFIRKGVLPEFKADQERMDQTSRFMANRIRPTDQAVSARTTMSLGGTPAPNATAGGGDGGLFSTLSQAAAGGAGGPGGAGDGSGIAFDAGGGAVGGGAGGGVAGVGGGAGGGVAGAGGGVTGAGGGVAGGAATGGVPGAFIAALSDLQLASLSSQPVLAVDPQSLRVDTRQQLATFRESNQHQVDRDDSQTIDVVSMLFDFFFDDEALPAPIKVLIGRLQIPILKVAILDREFFNQKKHPARRLLDSISRAAMGWGDGNEDEAELIVKIEEIVNFLINEFEEDVEVFDEARIELENFLNSEAKQSQQNEAGLHRREQARDEQIEGAQQAAADLVHKLTHGRELSFEVSDFLETTWTSVLFNAYLSLGEDSNHWRNLKRISSTFVWSLIPKHSEEERVKIIKTIPALLRALSKGMDLVRISTEVQNRIFQVLASEHAKIVKQTSRNIVTRKDDQTIWPGDGGGENAPEFDFSANEIGQIEVEEIAVDDDSPTIIDVTATAEVINDLNRFSAGVKQGQIQVDEEIVIHSETTEDADLAGGEDDGFMAEALGLEIGAWVEFNETEGKTQIARLSWKSNVTGNFVFVNRQGHKVRNMSVQGYANELRAGRARSIETSSVFDRAIYTIMSKMKH
ncbi:MAG: DUF1631 domain-containing protein [Gammaproteobacteria bacterium]|nr:DUF1631 domain-containing protein [Gammaproteobacteria bacterium]